MAVKVMIPTPLRQYTAKRESIELEAKTVAEAFAVLTAEYGDLRRHLFTDQGKIRSFVNVYLNDEDIRFLQKEQTRVGDNDVLSIVPSIAGGIAGGATGRGPEETVRRKRGRLQGIHRHHPREAAGTERRLEAARHDPSGRR